jgi:outer membrane protein TolC
LLYQINKVGQSEIILVQSEIAKSEVELLNLDRKRNTLLKEINFLIGRENLNQEIVIDKNLKLKEINLSSDQLDSLIILMNPELKSIQSMIEMNKNEIDANRRELIPDLMVSGMIMRMPKGMILTTKTFPMVTDAREEIMFGVMTSINLPFVPLAKKKITHKIEELENNIRSIEYERMNMIQQMRKEIQSLLLSMETNKDLIKLYEEKVLPSFENVYKLQLTELETGRISINSIVETNRMSLIEKMKYLMAILEYQMAFVELEKIIGQNLIKEYEK